MTLWTFIAFVVLTYFTLGAGYVESFVNYPLWHIIGPGENWPEYHRALGPRVIVLLAVPVLFVSPIVNVLLFFWRPPSIPRWTVWATLGLLLIAIVSTVVIQIPIQAQLDSTYDRLAVDRLISTSFWLRDVVGGVRAAIVTYMLWLAMAGAD